MVTFNLKTPMGEYPNAEIRVGVYPKEAPGDPVQYGWQVGSEAGEPLGTPTVNLWDPPVFPAPGCVFIKITPEYAGWLDSLEDAGLVEPTGRILPAGFVQAYAAEVKVLNSELIKEPK